MNIEELFNSVLTEHNTVISTMLTSPALLKDINKTTEFIITAFKNNRKILLCGNGGSAADAQHIATEFVCRFFKNRKALNAEALTVNTSSLTAISNDFSFNHIFSRQIEAKGSSGDILLGISTSGTSKNILSAFETAQKMNITTICLTGSDAPVSIDSLCDAVIRVPSSCTPRIQEGHILIGHIICEYVEAFLFNE